VKQTSHIPLLLLALSLGASAQPDQTRVDTGLDSTDVITWRRLQISDFHGKRPPGAFGTGMIRPVAVTCAYVIINPAARIFPIPIVDSTAQTIYRARVEGLSYHALMSRSCSWWNRDLGVSPAYVLQHEQMHFDIFEIAARSLNRDVPGLLKVMDVRGPTVQAVVDRAQRHIERTLARAQEETAGRNHKFDTETSFGFELQRQASWRMVLDRDLQQVKDYAVTLEELTPLPQIDERPRRRPTQ
jgi:hypothetical protein